MIKLVVTDVDGTIVGKDEILYQEMIDKVKQLKNQGIYYTIATGRVDGLVKEYVSKLELEVPYIACNGGTIIKGDKTIKRETIPLYELKKIITLADTMGMSLMYSIDGIETAYRETEYVLAQQRTYNRYHEVRDFTKEQWDAVRLDKLIVMAKVRDGSLDAIEKLCKTLPLTIGYKRYGNKAIDILSANATKARGIKEIIDILGISMDEVMTIGDDLNDVEMLKEAGIGVAVSNAQETVKQVADYVTEKACFEGVIEAIDKFCKLEWGNSLTRQAYSLPQLIKEQYEDLNAKIQNLLSQEEIQSFDSIILTGCGDSYAAAMATKDVFEELTGISTEVVTALDFSRYYRKEKLETKNNKTLVIGISISGNGVRICEDMEKANKYGAFTLGITKDETSDVGRNAKKLVKLDIPPFERGPGNRNYVVSVMSLLLLAIQMGERLSKYTRNQAEVYRKKLEEQGDLLDELLPKMDEVLLKIAKEWRDFPGYDFIGAGKDYATAWFGHAKIIEATGRFSMHINSEEWFHMNNFISDSEHCGTVIVASVNDAGFSRTKEVVTYAHRIGRPMIVITNGDKEDFDVETTYIKVPTSDFSPAMFLTQHVPVCILAGYIGAFLEERNCRGCLGRWAFAAGGEFIKNSEKIVQ